MTGLAALVLATPIFGLSLQPPDLHALQLRTPLPVLEASAEAAASGGALSARAQYVEDTRERNSLVKWHKPLGIATWGAMTATVVLGTIQYYNLYGFFDGRDDNPCVRGDAVFGQSQCSGTPWPHLGAAALTTGLYIGTGTLAALMPDPDDLSEGPGKFARTVRMHKLLRWVHLGGMVAQTVLGIFVANPGLIGMDRANDYDTLQALATVHLAAGYVTYGALTWAGSLMVF